MRLVGRHSGEREDEAAHVAPRPTRTRILILAFIVTVTLVAWGVLVYTAIDFGQEARSGAEDAWVSLSIATVGAAACLFTTLLLGGRVLTLLRGGEVKGGEVKGGEPAPARVRGGRRAAR